MFGVFMHFCHNVIIKSVGEQDSIGNELRECLNKAVCDFDLKYTTIPRPQDMMCVTNFQVVVVHLFNVRTTTRLLDLCFSQSAVDTMYHSQKRWVCSALPLFIRSSSLSFLPSHPSAQIINYPNTASHSRVYL